MSECNQFHDQLAGVNNHAIIAFTYATAAARTAATGYVRCAGEPEVPFTAADLYKVSVNQADGSLWYLSSISPITWTPFVAAPMPLANGRIFRYSGHFLNELYHNQKDGSGSGTIYPVTSTPEYRANEGTYIGIGAIRFDDTVEEGIAWHHRIPIGAVNLTLEYASKPRTIPPSTKGVTIKLYTKRWPDNGTPAAFSAGYVLGTITFDANLNIRLHSHTVSLATLGLVAGDFYTMELTRDGANVADTLVGDWNLTELALIFS